jgi:hypothetical protein
MTAALATKTDLMVSADAATGTTLLQTIILLTASTS